MTPCRERLDALLIADPNELDGTADTELARHVASCARCGTAAERLLAGLGDLDVALSERPSIDAAAIVARASLRAVDSAEDEETPPRASVPRRTVALWGSVAAAAAVLLLMVARPSTAPLPGALAELPSLAPPVVVPSSGQNAAVLTTADPDITVIWLY